MIGSHNTMSYLSVEKWWMKPLNIFAKCQNKYLYSQYIHGARCYDIRVYLKDNLYWKFCHGIINYKSLITIYDVIGEINSFDTKDEIYIRLVLEKGNSEDEFAKLCADLESKYPKIKFFGGVRKRDWKELYHFKNNPDVEQYISSMSGKWYWFIPWIYAKLFNKKNFIKIDNSKINLFDFI